MNLSSAFYQTRQRAFTLVELLVAASIMVLMLAFGIPTYLDFNKRQQVEDVVKQIESSFDHAVSQSKNGKIQTCSVLDGYQIAARSATEIYIREVCEAGAPAWPAQPYYQIPDGTGIVIDSFTDFDFTIDSVTGMVTANTIGTDSPWTLTISRDGSTVGTLNIYSTGTFNYDLP